MEIRALSNAGVWSLIEEASKPHMRQTTLIYTRQARPYNNIYPRETTHIHTHSSYMTLIIIGIMTLHDMTLTLTMT